jgi:hypothetical protein
MYRPLVEKLEIRIQLTISCSRLEANEIRYLSSLVNT